jgi:hypothetical protein
MERIIFTLCVLAIPVLILAGLAIVIIDAIS